MELVCPICASRATSGGPQEAALCPRCGHPLTAADATHPGDREVEDEALVAELRDAFGSGAYALETKPARLAAGSGHTSDAFAGSLGAGALPAGTRLADFEIIEELGRGGMGIVYRARQVSLSREVALKVLPAAGRLATADSTAVSRFRNEARAAARLHHTNIVPVYAQGECQDGFYYAMELIEGSTLDRMIRQRSRLLTSAPARPASNIEADPSARTVTRRSLRDRHSGTEGDTAPEPLPPRRTLEDYRHLARLMAEVADGLEHAHQNGVIHRDVKPHNLLLGQDDRLHIADFGLARLTDQPHLTMTGDVMGTPAYLSPEQVRADTGRVDHRTDVYSLGVTLYELTTWRRPFRGETRDQIISGICTVEPEPPRRVDARIPVDLETICLRAMEKEADRRFPSAGAMAEDLRRFADGRPILSRRIGLFGKAIKWARRHKAATVAIVSTAAVVMLTAGLTLNVVAGRRSEAAQLLQSAYQRVVHLDHRKPWRVIPDIDRAEQLGADPLRVSLVRALAGMADEDLAPVIELLEAILGEEPDNVEALYTLARAQWLDRQHEASRQTFQRAEDLGGPQTAEQWYFRGLAMHHDRTPEAIKSYEKARDLLVAEGEFFPTAVSHLARARNQQMYSTRSIETFAEARESLEQLVANGYYGSYPHYLLSIAHRLAAEIYRGSEGARDDDRVVEHYAVALDWARRGQEEEPDNDRPVTAEAEALESMGDLEAAIEARTRAIELAAAGLRRCEQYHYRWRLHYWLGHLDQALEDLQVHAECDPGSQFYSHVYPALVYAEAGDMELALDLARQIDDATPTDAQAVLWSATCLRLLGQPAEADQLLDATADRVDFAVGLEAPQSEDWVRALYAFAQNTNTTDKLDNMLDLAERVDEPWKLRGEVHFHAGAKALGSGDRHEAFQRFFDAYRAFDSQIRYTYHAKILWRRLRQNADWPPWIPATPVEASDAWEDHSEEDGSPPAIHQIGEGRS